MLASLESQDRLEFDKALVVAHKIICTLILELTNNAQLSSTSNIPSTPPNIASIVSQNLLIKMEFLLESKKVRIKSIIDNAQVSQQHAQRTEFEEEFFVPIIPNHCIELEIFVTQCGVFPI